MSKNEKKFLARVTREVEVTQEEAEVLIKRSREMSLSNEESKLLGEILARCTDNIVSLDFYDTCLPTCNLPAMEQAEAGKGRMTKINFTEAITLNSGYIVCAELSKEEVRDIFALCKKAPKNDAMEPDESYVCGEIQFIFREDMKKLDEVNICPTYEDEDGGLINGDFISAPDSFWMYEQEARDFVNRTE